MDKQPAPAGAVDEAGARRVAALLYDIGINNKPVFSPTRMAISPDGTSLYVDNGAGVKLTLVDAAGDLASATQTVTVGASPAATGGPAPTSAATTLGESLSPSLTVPPVPSPSVVHATSADRIVGLSVRDGVLTVKLSGPGVLTVGRRRHRVRRRSTLKITVALSAAQRARLTREHHLSLSVPVRFVPKVGDPQRTTVRVTL